MISALAYDNAFDRYLLLDDTEDDIGAIITVLCEQSSSSQRFDALRDYRNGGEA